MKRAFLFLLLAVAGVSSATAKFRVLGNGTIAAQGEIMEDTPAQFVQFVSVHPNANLVWLDSVGGNIVSALAIAANIVSTLALGLSIRKLNLSTYVGGLTAESVTELIAIIAAVLYAIFHMGFHEKAGPCQGEKDAVLVR